ncbi:MULTISPECIES: SufD family Fe-S cluster assembly protein [Arcobacteraceae]|uniref:SufD family Fe-S cluster assembly protein n=1 Tax=Arcobacteraceae TaxID=2808963 RepID=UPI000DEB94C8|nr:SufD family Fe-S cluster assembly protein [Arcobacter sp. CECT 9188]RBQ27707.1 Fe-S assembly protein [Arcobacter sp. CECT 9188]
MQVINFKDLKLPQKRDEEFLKIDFSSLFSYDFKNVKTSTFSLDLKSKKDESSYDSILFDITKNLYENQKVLTINEDTKEPIILIHTLNEDETAFTNSLEIKLKDGIKAQVIEVFNSKSTNSSFFVNRSLVVGKNAHLEYVKVQDIVSQNSIIFSLKTSQDDNSNVELTNFEFGDGFIVNSFENTINSQEVNYELNGLLKLENKANSSTLVKTIHNNKSSRSNINYKNSLKDNSRAVVKIKSIVNQEALYSKAFQNCNSILLSDDATIFAQPHLEIYIDELEASHGTTTGTLNKEQLLYLCARGIPKEKAYDMLLVAFESSIKNNLKNEKIKEFIDNYKRENYV